MIAVFEYTTKVHIMPEGWELGHRMTTLEDGSQMLLIEKNVIDIAKIAMMLLGAFPAVYLIVKLASKPLGSLGKLIGINDSAAGGMIATLANNIPMFQIMKDMDPAARCSTPPSRSARPSPSAITWDMSQVWPAT